MRRETTGSDVSGHIVPCTLGRVSHVRLLRPTDCSPPDLEVLYHHRHLGCASYCPDGTKYTEHLGCLTQMVVAKKIKYLSWISKSRNPPGENGGQSSQGFWHLWAPGISRYLAWLDPGVPFVPYRFNWNYSWQPVLWETAQVSGGLMGGNGRKLSAGHGSVFVRS